MEDEKQMISVVVPVYNEGKNIERLLLSLRKVTRELTAYQWQYVFVDDGSTDDSLAILSREAAADPAVRVVALSRNFGKEIALTAGLESVDKGAIIFMDADLQHPPELIFELVKEWEQGVEIVATIRSSIKGQPRLRRMGSWLFYAVLNRISDANFMNGTTDFRLLDSKVVTVLKTFTERTRLVRGLIDWMGFEKVYVRFDAPARTGGKPGYSYWKLFRLAMGSISGFSMFPLRITGYLGLLITTFSGLLLLYMLLNQLLFHWTVFTPIAIFVVGNTFLVGLVLCGLGLLALYIGNIHTEVINRPLYIVRRRINFHESDPSC
jgi:polyisoprenyl-phosphate glycosyltransferase